MARICVEDQFLIDPRFRKLSRELGRWQAIGMCVDFWRLAQGYWCRFDKETKKCVKQGIPKDIYALEDFDPLLISTGIVVAVGEVYFAAGSEEHFHWLVSIREKGSHGGDSKKNNNLTVAHATAQLQPSSSPALPLNLILNPKTNTYNGTLKTEVREIVEPIIDALNKVSGGGFKASGKYNQKMILARVREYEATVPEVIVMINEKGRQWANDPNMRRFLRPETLFGVTKFEGYMSEAKVALNLDKQHLELFEGGLENV